MYPNIQNLGYSARLQWEKALTATNHGQGDLSLFTEYSVHRNSGHLEAIS